MRSQEANTRSRLMTGLLVFALGLSVTGIGVANTDPPREFRDSFSTPGPLPGTLPGDPWQIVNGVWTVTDAALTDGNPAAAQNRVLIQNSKAATPNEPLAFVRGLSFREVTAEVTAAFLDPTDALGSLPLGASVGLVARAPIFDGKGDPDNLYLFSAFVTGVTRQFPTGKALGLFKRVARGYYLLDTKVVHTWADLTKPHRYKVVLGNGRVRAYFDNRLVIDHTDIPSGDLPTIADPLPGLPFDQGAVGLRTSGTRAMFDNFVVVGNDAYEGRAALIDAYTQIGEGQQARRGDAVTLSNSLQTLEANRVDTGYQYSGSSLNSVAIRALENPFSSDSEFGATARTRTKGDSVVSTVRFGGGDVKLREPVNASMTLTLVAKTVEVEATASCSSRGSKMSFTDASVMVEVQNDPVLPDMVIGPFPLQTTYPPNTVIYQRAGVISLIAHPVDSSSAPSRVSSAALRLVIPEGGSVEIAQNNYNLPGVTTVRTPGASSPTPPLDLVIAPVTAGRYCTR
ncbi:MAG: hypothetical protein ACLGH3_08815 [Actinomycetota bacterium]